MAAPRMSPSRKGQLLQIAIAAHAILLFLIMPHTLRAWDFQGATHRVVMRNMGFDPPEESVKAGDSVEWKNEDMLAHTVTADDGSVDSGLIAPGESWKMTFKNAGTFVYHCRPHPKMMASLVVTGGQGGKPQSFPSGSGRQATSESLRWVLPTSPDQIHPILVNFTAALLPLALLSDLLGRIFRRQSLHDAAWWMVLYAATITPLTVAAGWWWKHAAGPDLPTRLITVHQWLGTSVAVTFIFLAIWRWKLQKDGSPPSAAYLACTLLVVLALVYQGSLGGAIV